MNRSKNPNPTISTTGAGIFVRRVPGKESYGSSRISKFRDQVSVRFLVFVSFSGSYQISFLGVKSMFVSLS